MKSAGRIITVLCFILLCLPGAALAGNGRSCEAKEELLRQKLEFAKAHGNSGEIRGLERALFNVRSWCSDRDLLAEAEKTVREKQEKVAEREEELREAVADGDKESKIAKRQSKLAEAREELAEAIGERDALKEVQ